MKVGIDVDGTLARLPWFFDALCRGLLAAGHEVHIITFRDRIEQTATAAKLDSFGVVYSKLHMPEHTVQSTEAWKARVASDLGLDVMIDDDPENLHAMPHGVARLWLCDDKLFDLDVWPRACRNI